MAASPPLAGDPGRAPAVRDMFARIAPGYDRANRWMSLGIDQRWRRRAIAALGPAIDGDILDLCAGTLDFSLALTAGHPRSGDTLIHPSGAFPRTGKAAVTNPTRVVAVDFCAEMLEVGRARLPPGAPVTIVCADARALPLPDASVDGAVAGFGLRNVPEPERAVAEVHRVLRPGGRLVVVDFFRPTTPLARLLDATYNRVVLPLVGGLLTGDASAYRYLADSMAAWHDRAGFEQLCRDAGFAVVHGAELFPPVAALVVAEKAGSSSDSEVPP